MYQLKFNLRTDIKIRFSIISNVPTYCLSITKIQDLKSINFYM